MREVKTELEKEIPITSKRVEITKENPSVLIATYGTLRLNEGNYRRILHGKSEYLGTFTSTPSYTMYGRRSPFPVVVDSGNGTIVYEVHRVSDPEILEKLHSLEGCSGIPDNTNDWYSIAPIKTPVGDAWIYVHKTYKADSSSIIKTGDWKHKSI